MIPTLAPGLLFGDRKNGDPDQDDHDNDDLTYAPDLAHFDDSDNDDSDDDSDGTSVNKPSSNNEDSDDDGGVTIDDNDTTAKGDNASAGPPLAGVTDTTGAPIAGVDADDEMEEEIQTETVEPTAQPNSPADTHNGTVSEPDETRTNANADKTDESHQQLVIQ